MARGASHAEPLALEDPSAGGMDGYLQQIRSGPRLFVAIAPCRATMLDAVTAMTQGLGYGLA
jgi:hypothetical protein